MARTLNGSVTERLPAPRHSQGSGGGGKCLLICEH